MKAVIHLVARYITGGNEKTAQLFLLFVAVMGMLMAWNWAITMGQEPQLYIGPEEVQVPINQL